MRATRTQIFIKREIDCHQEVTITASMTCAIGMTSIPSEERISRGKRGDSTIILIEISMGLLEEESRSPIIFQEGSMTALKTFKTGLAP